MKARYRTLLIAGVLAAGVSAGTLAKLPAHTHATMRNGAEPGAVAIDNFNFGPSELSVAAGTTVKWTNRDDIPHTVVSPDGVFKSHALDTDESFSYKFDKAGTYNYFCSLHPKMTGKVVVH